MIGYALSRARSRGALVILLGLGTACTAGSATETDARARGRGLQVAALPAADRADVYEVALRESFDVGPGLNLLIHPAMLPRAGGFDTTTALPAELASAMRASGVVRGSCRPRAARPGQAPRCETATPGYTVRVSDVFRVAGDTVLLHLTAEQVWTTRDAQPHPALAFEERYTLVRDAGRWVVVRKERMMLT